MPEIVIKKFNYDTFIVLLIVINLLSLGFDLLFQTLNYGNRLPIVQAFYPGLDLTISGIAVGVVEAVIYGLVDAVLFVWGYNNIIAKKFPLKIKY